MLSRAPAGEGVVSAKPNQPRQPLGRPKSAQSTSPSTPNATKNLVPPDRIIRTLDVRQNKDLPEEFSVLTANKAVGGGRRWDVVRLVRERRIRGTFWDIWVRGGDRFQVTGAEVP